MTGTATTSTAAPACPTCHGTGDLGGEVNGASIGCDRTAPLPPGTYTCGGTGLPRLFHGTAAELAPGDVLLPGDQVGKDNWPGMDNAWAVWLTPYPEVAAAYGPHVYEAVPSGTVVDWCDENGWDRTRENTEYAADRATVVRAVDTTPQQVLRDWAGTLDSRQHTASRAIKVLDAAARGLVAGLTRAAAQDVLRDWAGTLDSRQRVAARAIAVLDAHDPQDLA
jgi:hypothetical protein